MRLEHFEEKPKGPELLHIARSVQESSADILESEKAGFAFPVPKQVRDMEDSELQAGEGLASVRKLELFKALLRALKEAWEKEIAPRLPNVRNNPPGSMKSGTDFFTEADTSSETRIRDIFLQSFGERNVRVFGEEAGKYLGNIESHIGIRIDPVDGTESMKYGKTDWGVQIGVYEGTPDNERQILGGIFYPEKNMLVFHVEGIGVFVEDLELAQSRKVELVHPQDSIKNIIIQMWEHSDVAQRGNTEELRRRLSDKKARLRTTASGCADALEALLTKGNRAFIMDGDYNEVDFIPAAMLEQVGYKIYTWEGEEKRADDMSLKNGKLIMIPPGKAGREILEAVRGLTSR